MSAELLVLRVVHVLGGVFWLGSGLFTSLFLLPALAGSGADAGAVMAGLQRRRLFTVLPVVAVLTILSGLRLMWIGSGGFSPAYFESGMGLTFAISGALAILGFLFSLLVARPAMLRSGQLAASMGTVPAGPARDAISARIGVLQRRGALSSFAAVGLVTLAGAGMAVGRYVA